MNWIKVKIDYFSDNYNDIKEKLINIFNDIGVKELEVIDTFTENMLDYTENFKVNNSVWTIIGYLIDNRFAHKKIQLINEQVKYLSDEDENFGYEIYTSKCNDKDWQDEWKKYFHTTKITENIIVKPSWEDYEKKENEIVIDIEPGVAFGTGTHETTSLCVNFLEKYATGKKKLLDVGCGSGILMLIAKKLNIPVVHGIDIDDAVVTVVEENYLKNGLHLDEPVMIGNLSEKVDRTDSTKKYDIVVSNILVDVLTTLLPSIVDVLENNAIVIFSGILHDKMDKFIEETEKYGLTIVEKNEKNGWCSIVLTNDEILK